MGSLKNSLVTGTKLWLNPFVRDKQGNVAIIFALASIPVLVAMGVAVDYSRASDARALMQTAADSAILAAIIDTSTSTCAVKQANASKAVKTVMDRHSFAYNNEDTVVTEDGSGCKIAFSADVDTSIMSIIGIPTIKVSVTASAAAGPGKKIEIAMALDNTASMGDGSVDPKKNGIQDLKDAATKFVNTLSSKIPSTQLKMGIVPFVAMVNPGKSAIDNAEMADYKGEADYHGYYLSQQHVEGSIYCNHSGGGTTFIGGKPKSQEGPKVLFNDVTDASPLQKMAFRGKSVEQGVNFYYIMQSLLGVGTAHATEKGGGTMTPTDLPTILGTWKDHDFVIPGKPGSFKIKLPRTSSDYDFTFKDPDSASSNCLLFNPKHINHFDLFSRTGPTGVEWKGCVMARKAPYDVDDAPPTSDANTKFVPFFWPSEPEVDKNAAWNGVFGDPLNPVYRNVYLPSPGTTTYPALFLTEADAVFSKADIFKYNNTTNGLGSYKIIENATNTLGPNKGCPNEVTPLTSDTSLILKEVKNLSMWNGGGTLASEGLMWAWRVLSPNKPYAVGSSYEDSSVQKYIVLMTDGVNYLNDTGPDIPLPDVAPIISEQTAYGAIWPRSVDFDNSKTFAPQVRGTITNNPDGIYDKTSADALLDDRFSLACENAKRVGVKVFTIYFSHGSIVDDDDKKAAEKAVRYLKKCAGDANHFDADDGLALQIAFEKIAKSIVAGGVRLTK